MGKTYYANLIRAKSALAETLRNAWNLNKKSGFIQNLSALSHCTKAGSTTFCIHISLLYDMSNARK